MALATHSLVVYDTTMSESIIQSETDYPEASAEPGEPTSANGTSVQLIGKEDKPQATTIAAPTKPASIIWTPRFIVLFTLTLLLGLSAESLLTRGWLNHAYLGGWVILAHLLLLLGCWIATTVFARSPWTRFGALLGCAWAMCSGINASLFLHPQSANPLLLAYLHVLIAGLLLGSFGCLSIIRTPLRRWDAWFFGLAPLIGGGFFLVAYFRFSPVHSLNVIEQEVAMVALVLAVLAWWGRPSCWKAQPAPTLFLGLAPTIQLLLSIPRLATPEAYFFFSQVILLCLLLGALRILQCELRN